MNLAKPAIINLKMQRNTEQSELGWFIRRNLAVIIFLAIAAGSMYYLYSRFNPEEGRPFTIQTGAAADSSTENSYAEVPFGNVSQQFVQSPGPLQIAIVVGHRGSDSGAVCEDSGLQEVQINEAIAMQVQEILETAGIPITLFNEFDERIGGFSADALISLHADSCKPLDGSFTGYKTTVNESFEAVALQTCIEENYARATGLPVHPTTITDDMTHYHAFRNVSAESPAILLEMGFMFNDQDLLTNRSDVAARGIADGVLCFLRNSDQ